MLFHIVNEVDVKKNIRHYRIFIEQNAMKIIAVIPSSLLERESKIYNYYSLLRIYFTFWSLCLNVKNKGVMNTFAWTYAILQIILFLSPFLYPLSYTFITNKDSLCGYGKIISYRSLLTPSGYIMSNNAIPDVFFSTCHHLAKAGNHISECLYLSCNVK